MLATQIAATTAKICAAGRSTRARARPSQRPTRPPTFLLTKASAGARSPSICRAAEFGGYVVTRFLPDDNFHAYRPTVQIRPLLLLCLPVRRFIFCEVQSSSPALLTRGGPLLPMLVRAGTNPARRRIRSLTVMQLAPRLLVFTLPRRTHLPQCCPARHFGGNQLPDSSIGLSPLHPAQAIDLNVRTA